MGGAGGAPPPLPPPPPPPPPPLTVGGAGGALDARVRVEVEVELVGVADRGVHHRPRQAVTRAVAVLLVLGQWEQPGAVALLDHHKGDGGALRWGGVGVGRGFRGGAGVSEDGGSRRVQARPRSRPAPPQAGGCRRAPDIGQHPPGWPRRSSMARGTPPKQSLHTRRLPCPPFLTPPAAPAPSQTVTPPPPRPPSSPCTLSYSAPPRPPSPAAPAHSHTQRMGLPSPCRPRAGRCTLHGKGGRSGGGQAGQGEGGVRGGPLGGTR